MTEACAGPEPDAYQVVLGGMSLAAIIGLVVYAARHDRRQQLEFDVLREDIQLNEAVLDRLLPGYTDALADQFTQAIAQRTMAEDEEIRTRVVEPWLERGGRPNLWSRRMFQKLGLE